MSNTLREHKDEFDDYYSPKGQTGSWADWNRDKLGGNNASHKYLKLKEVRKNKFMLNLIPLNSRVIIDAGAGFGSLAIQINKNIPGAILLCTDISEAMLKYLKENFRIHGIKAHIVLCALEYLPVKSNTVNCVTLREVLEHVQSPEKSMTELKRVLIGKGKIVLTTPHNSKSYNLFRHKLLGRVFPIDEVKISYKDELIPEDKLTELVARNDLRKITTKYFDFEIPLLTGLFIKSDNIFLISILFYFYSVMEIVFPKFWKTRILMVLENNS